MTAKTFRRVCGYTESVLRNKPIRHSGQDLRDFPTYTIPEAAISLGIPERTLRSWYLGANPIFSAPALVGKKKVPLLSFRDLIDVHIVKAARTYHNVPMSRIQSALRPHATKVTIRTRYKINVFGYLQSILCVSSRALEGEKKPSSIFRDTGRRVSPRSSSFTPEGSIKIGRDTRLACSHRDYWVTTIASVQWRCTPTLCQADSS